MLILQILVGLTLSSPSGADTVANRDTVSYTQYETESVSAFRQQVDFHYPMPENLPGIDPMKDPLSDPTLKADSSQVDYDLPFGLERLIEGTKGPGDIYGFRVQLYAGGDLQDANDVRADFIEIHPEMPSYRLWIQPTFRVRVGDFISKNDALIFCNALRNNFPGAFVVPDQIEKPKGRKQDYKEDEEEVFEDYPMEEGEGEGDEDEAVNEGEELLPNEKEKTKKLKNKKEDF